MTVGFLSVSVNLALRVKRSPLITVTHLHGCLVREFFSLVVPYNVLRAVEAGGQS